MEMMIDACIEVIKIYFRELTENTAKGQEITMI